MKGGIAALAAASAIMMLTALPCGAVGDRIPLLNRGGTAVAYIDAEDGSTIYLWGGVPVAYLEGETIFGFNGRHLGWFEDGIVRNRRGERAGFTEETIGSVGGTARLPVRENMRRTRPVPLPPEPAPPRPPDVDIDSPFSLRELLTRGRL